jgi:hypothetical protein
MEQQEVTGKQPMEEDLPELPQSSPFLAGEKAASSGLDSGSGEAQVPQPGPTVGETYAKAVRPGNRPEKLSPNTGNTSAGTSGGATVNPYDFGPQSVELAADSHISPELFKQVVSLLPEKPVALPPGRVIKSFKVDHAKLGL